MEKVQVAVLVGPKSRGSNLQALIENGEKLGTPFRVAVVIVPQASSPGLDLARKHGVKAEIVPPGDEYGARLLSALENVEWVCLAGYLRLLPTEVLERFAGKVLNIHPALLPKYGGKGMYGIHVHEAVLAAGERESGCSVHVVTPVYDEGEVLLQLKCPVERDDTAEVLQARVLKLEHVAFSQALSAAILKNR